MSIQSLDRAISILNLFKNSRYPIGSSEIANKLGLARTTVHGLVSTLVRNGFLQKNNATHKYSLGFALYELSSIQMAHLEINQRATIPLQNLSKKTNRICHVAIWDRNSILVTMSVQPHGHESTVNQIGPRLPAYCTALGKAILANMSESEQKIYLDGVDLVAYTPNTIIDRPSLEKELFLISEQGYSVSRKEVLLNQLGLGASVMGSDGLVTGAISIRLNNEDEDNDFMAQTIEDLTQTSYQISLDMGYQPVKMEYSF
jgi:DNA-binding IclR family transcriptional regulator